MANGIFNFNQSRNIHENPFEYWREYRRTRLVLAEEALQSRLKHRGTKEEMVGLALVLGSLGAAGCLANRVLGNKPKKQIQEIPQPNLGSRVIEKCAGNVKKCADIVIDNPKTTFAVVAVVGAAAYGIYNSRQQPAAQERREEGAPILEN